MATTLYCVFLAAKPSVPSAVFQGGWTYNYSSNGNLNNPAMPAQLLLTNYANSLWFAYLSTTLTFTTTAADFGAAQFRSPPLLGQATVASGSWSVAFARQNSLKASKFASQGKIAIFLMDSTDALKTVIVARRTVGTASTNVSGLLTVFSTAVTGAAFTPAAGDYIMVELGAAATVTSTTGTGTVGIDARGTTIITTDNAVPASTTAASVTCPTTLLYDANTTMTRQVPTTAALSGSFVRQVGTTACLNATAVRQVAAIAAIVSSPVRQVGTTAAVSSGATVPARQVGTTAALVDTTAPGMLLTHNGTVLSWGAKARLMAADAVLYRLTGSPLLEQWADADTVLGDNSYVLGLTGAPLLPTWLQLTARSVRRVPLLASLTSLHTVARQVGESAALSGTFRRPVPATAAIGFYTRQYFDTNLSDPTRAKYFLGAGAEVGPVLWASGSADPFASFDFTTLPYPFYPLVSSPPNSDALILTMSQGYIAVVQPPGYPLSGTQQLGPVPPFSREGYLVRDTTRWVYIPSDYVSETDLDDTVEIAPTFFPFGAIETYSYDESAGVIWFVNEQNRFAGGDGPYTFSLDSIPIHGTIATSTTLLLGDTNGGVAVLGGKVYVLLNHLSGHATLERYNLSGVHEATIATVPLKGWSLTRLGDVLYFDVAQPNPIGPQRTVYIYNPATGILSAIDIGVPNDIVWALTLVPQHSVLTTFPASGYASPGYTDTGWTTAANAPGTPFTTTPYAANVTQADVIPDNPVTVFMRRTFTPTPPAGTTLLDAYVYLLATGPGGTNLPIQAWVNGKHIWCSAAGTKVTVNSGVENSLALAIEPDPATGSTAGQLEYRVVVNYH